MFWGFVGTLFEVLLLWFVLYQGYRVVRGTRIGGVVVGMVMVMVCLILLANWLDLRVVGWILKVGTVFLVFAFLVIFQPELRNGVARLASGDWLLFETKKQKEFLDRFVEAVVRLSKKRFGALFAIERGVKLEDYEKTGVGLDAVFSSELVMTIFHPKTALHDGGVVLKNERIATAACIFPVSEKELSDRSLGLRHRAGFGISEEADAIAIVVSEETGSISVVVDGEISRHLSEEEFRDKLREVLLKDYGEHVEEVVPEELDGEDGVDGSGDRDLASD